MKVIYKKNIGEKIIEEIRKAKSTNKEIEEILLSDSEWREFSLKSYGRVLGSSVNACVFGDILIKKEAVE